MAEMSPADVPQQLVGAAFSALKQLQIEASRFEAAGQVPNVDIVEALKVALAAVLPLHAQQVREQIASELYGLPIAQHLGIPRGNATQHAADVAEAAQRWMVAVVQRPDLVPESAGHEAKLNAKVRENPAWPVGLPKPRSYGYPTGDGRLRNSLTGEVGPNPYEEADRQRGYPEVGSR